MIATSELNGISSDVPCGSKDDNRLTDFQTSMIEQSLPDRFRCRSKLNGP
jgi:hypothetical protein